MDSTIAEFDLIERIRQRVDLSKGMGRGDVVLGIGDDAALLQVPTGMQLVVAMDTLNSGVHFPPETAPADIGWKALAVNLSDLAAMGALPAWCTLSLSLPDADGGFVDGLLDGFLALADEHGIALVGGDTTRGPLSVSVAIHGFIEPGMALRRDGARVGDEVWISGTPGDAAGALAQWMSGQAMDPTLRLRLNRPTPRVSLARALRGIATACIDVSDGLLADLAHVCDASAVGARVEVELLPASRALRDCFAADARKLLQATGGDDYELCFTAPTESHRAVLDAASAHAVTCIGRLIAGSGVVAVDAQGDPWQPAATGYRHFA